MAKPRKSVTQSSPSSSSGREKRKKGKEGRGQQPIYTAPQVFLDLEQDYKQQARQIKKTYKQMEEQQDDEEVDQLASDGDDSGFFSDSHRSKKSKKNKGKGKGKKKKEKFKGRDVFTSLPEELLLDIFGRVDHESLFHLYSLCSTFYQLLRPKVKIWTLARKALDPPLPEVHNLTEKQLASLLYSKKCCFDECKNEDGEGDPFLRIVLCKTHRKEDLVDVHKFSADYPEMMHSSPDCCISTFISASGNHTKSRWVLRSNLEDESEELLTRERKDIDEAETEQWNAIERGQKKGRKAVHVAEFDKKPPKEGTGRRVVKYLAKRKRLRKVYEEDGEALYKWMEERKQARKQEMEEQAKEKEESASERRQAIEERLLDEPDDAYTEEDFEDDHWKKNHLVSNGTSDIDDKLWKELKPKIIKIVKHCREMKEKAEGQGRIQRRIEHLRKKLYEPRRGDETNFPLFADFCLLPSVLKLLDLEDDSYEGSDLGLWREHKVTAQEEADEWRNEARIAAADLVLSRVLPRDEYDQLDDDDIEEQAEDHEWFDRVQAFLFCDIPNCSTLSPDHQVFFGSFDELLDHQHEVHHDLKPKFTKKAHSSSSSSSFRFSLPLAVSQALSNLLLSAGFDKDDNDPMYEETGEDLDALLSNETVLQWENAPRVGFGKSKKDSDWRKIVSLPLNYSQSRD
ncbi:uncharacterized protein JCM6883_006250 [Sporobolomyces salmoneus]|uniref:uncharacterized protein n=1 Tax=Sporobolomyces salmoneus TaxID=183962 RepID=UPI00317C6507